MQSLTNESTNTNDDVCPICGGFGVVRHDVPVDHPDFGKLFPCVCQADKIKMRKANQLRTMSNLDAFADRTFATFKIDHSLLSDDQAVLRSEFADLGRNSGLDEAQRSTINIAAELALRYAIEPDDR